MKYLINKVVLNVLEEGLGEDHLECFVPLRSVNVLYVVYSISIGVHALVLGCRFAGFNRWCH